MSHDHLPARCPRVLRNYQPFDAETRRYAEPRDVACIEQAGHSGFHMGDDGMPFGPWRAS